MLDGISESEKSERRNDKMLMLTIEELNTKFKISVGVIMLLAIILVFSLVTNFGALTTLKDTRQMVEQREETFYLQSNISSDSLLVWSKDSVRVW